LRDKEGEEIPTDDTGHRFVRDIFLQGSDKLRRDIADDLGLLRSLRNRADYEDSVPKLQDDTQKALHRTNRVLYHLEKLRPRKNP
jgi:hypothetical protein